MERIETPHEGRVFKLVDKKPDSPERRANFSHRRKWGSKPKERMGQKTYSEKLRDPRWQKKRLKIIERDKFTCRVCQNDKETLHVHHLSYKGDPWDVDDDELRTVCEGCHSIMHDKEQIKSIQAGLTTLINKNPYHTLVLIQAFADKLKISEQFTNHRIENGKAFH